jgi:hypothetical protein
MMQVHRALLALLTGLIVLACRASEPRADWSSISTELEQRAAEDQACRARLSMEGTFDKADVERLREIDARNTEWMKGVISRHGWPSAGAVGENGAVNAWMLVQHADHDVAFQERCLELLRAAVAAGEADGRSLAYLEDRVAMHRGRPQRYGTQFRAARDGDGYEPYPLEDEARVDELRASVGLGSLSEYARQINGE